MTPRPKSSGSISARFAAYALRVGRSRIQGLGVYAAQLIPPRRKVIEYCGERINLRQAVARVRKVCGPGGSKYLSIFRLNRCWLIDGAVGGSGAELINHSCDPNLKTRIVSGHIIYFSRWRIRKGEELTVDYKLHPKAFRLRCRCGSPNCRGTINRK
jgi:uncharacterized protein